MLHSREEISHFIFFSFEGTLSRRIKKSSQKDHRSLLFMSLLLLKFTHFMYHYLFLWVYGYKLIASFLQKLMNRGGFHKKPIIKRFVRFKPRMPYFYVYRPVFTLLTNHFLPFYSTLTTPIIFPFFPSLFFLFSSINTSIKRFSYPSNFFLPLKTKLIGICLNYSNPFI